MGLCVWAAFFRRFRVLENEIKQSSWLLCKQDLQHSLSSCLKVVVHAVGFCRTVCLMKVVVHAVGQSAL